MDDFGTIGLSSMAELNYLRLEAMDLFERCLTEGKPAYLEGFIEEQISQEPPRLDVLREVAEDLHQRLLSLREYHFDVLDRTVRTLNDDFGLSVGPVSPTNLTEGSAHLEPARIIPRMRDHNPQLTGGEEALLRRMLEMSLDTAAQLRSDIDMTETLYNCICDWLDGLSATIARRFWADGRNDSYSGAVQ